MKGAGHRRLLTRVPSAVYDRIDNSVYDTASEAWWQPEAALHQMKHVFNPARVDYAKRKIFEDFKINPSGKRALEVGCGGGILSEEITRLGFDTTGIDPSEPSLRVAADHAQAGGLDIRYLKGVGESLPFPAGSYDVVFCCDVLEHVRDLPKVISEISRVLKTGGVFIYDTFNRTLISKLVAVKIGQEWKSWAFMPADLHVWKMFIKPGELKSLFKTNHLRWMEHQGLKPDKSVFRIQRFLRQRAGGRMSYRELGEKIRMVEGRSRAVMYMGCAVKSS